MIPRLAVPLHYTFLFFLYFRLSSFTAPCGDFVSSLMPLFKHRWSTTFPMPAPMSSVVSPARPPEEEAEGCEQQEEGQQRAQATEAVSKTEMRAVEGQPVSIIRIWRGHGLTRGRLNGNR